MCRAYCGACADRVEWLTLRAVCPGTGIGEQGAWHLALALSKNNTLLKLGLFCALLPTVLCVVIRGVNSKSSGQ